MRTDAPTAAASFAPVASLQLGFDFEAAADLAPECVEGGTIAEQFASFHRLNPHVYMAITSIAREIKREGRSHSSMKRVFETLRDKFACTTRGDRWKLNNNYTAHHARLVMEREPDLAGFFSLRERKGAP